MLTVRIHTRWASRVALLFLVLPFALMAAPASAQTFQDIGRALDAFAGPQQPQRPQQSQRPPAPRQQAQGGDPSRRGVCSSFGQAAAVWEQRAQRQGCNLRIREMTTFGGNQARATNWCMRTSDASFRTRSPQALGHKDLLERHCSVQLRRPVRL
jgi:hypothetical protein